LVVAFLFLYQALQRIIQFKVHSEGISLEAETLTGLHRFEVRPQAAVAAAGNGEVLSNRNILERAVKLAPFLFLPLRKLLIRKNI
jgi:hypothetical protein